MIFNDTIHRLLGNTWVARLFNHLHGTVELFLMKGYKDKKIINMIKGLRREGHFLFKPSEIFHIHSVAKACVKLSGDYAEVGVYNGTSAKVICLEKGKKPLYLFDTFSGLPETISTDKRFSKKMFVSSLEKVQLRLKNYSNVHIYQGFFPNTSAPVKDKQFAFVHLDVDIYASTKSCLEFFYDRMVKGGVILTHDYAQAKGVRRAFDEFFADKQEGIIELSMTQAMVSKL